MQWEPAPGEDPSCIILCVILYAKFVHVRPLVPGIQCFEVRDITRGKTWSWQSFRGVYSYGILLIDNFLLVGFAVDGCVTE